MSTTIRRKLDLCSVPTKEWRKHKPKSSFQYPPIVELEERIHAHGETEFCVRRGYNQELKVVGAINCWSDKTEAGQKFESLCALYFPWRAKMRQRQVLSGSKR